MCTFEKFIATVGTVTNNSASRPVSSISDWGIEPLMRSGMIEVVLIRTGICHGRWIRFEVKGLGKNVEVRKLLHLRGERIILINDSVLTP
jgi:hypothetical protein